MIAVLAAVTVLLCVSLAVLAGSNVNLRRTHRPAPAANCRRILFPFVVRALSEPALDAALRMARAEEATLVPVFLARVSLNLPLDTPLPRQSALAIPLQEAIEQRAARFGVAVDSRIERGRNQRHALRLTIEHERYDRIVIAAAAPASPGFGPDDVAWLLQHAPGEIVVLRPDRDEVITPPGSARTPRRRLPRRGSLLVRLGSDRGKNPSVKTLETGRGFQ